VPTYTAETGAGTGDEVSDGPDDGETSEGSPPPKVARRFMLHVFAGRPRVGGFDDCSEAHGVEVTNIDLLLGGGWHDVTKAEVRAALLHQVRARRWEVVWIGLPCASGTVHWTGAAKRPRERHEPDGASNLPPWLQRYVALHNIFIGFSEELGKAAFESGVTFVVENPPDYGDPTSIYYRWKARAHCPLWLTSAMVRLRAETGASLFTGCQCMLGGLFKKPTSLLTAGPLANRLRSFGELICTHAGHARVASGWRSDGRANSADAAAYPVPMCLWVVDTLFGADAAGAPAHGYAARPQAVSAAAAATLQSEANRRAANDIVSQLSGEQVVADADEGERRTLDGAARERLRSGEWRAAPQLMPAYWPEREDAQGQRVELALTAELPFLSRRRCEPEDAEVLARRSLPAPHVVPVTTPKPAAQVEWPAEAPPRPIHVSQLYHPGIYAEIKEVVRRIGGEVAKGRPTAMGGEGGTIPKSETHVWKAAECQPEWARQCSWDCSNPHDCVPLQPYSEQDPPVQEAVAEFFLTWAAFLRHEDMDMIHQVVVTGAESRAAMARDTSLMGHHGGLRNDPAPAFERVEKDTARGWMTEARDDLWTVPTRGVPKNCLRQFKWRIAEGELRRKLKIRVTTDDSIRPDGNGGTTDARNPTIDREGWGGAELPGPRTVAEAVAIIKAVARDMGLTLGARSLERVALWALDLSDAYRALACARSEWWQQGFCWEGGMKLDLRCVFGSAHLVDFFQRVSAFVLRVAAHRIHEYDRTHPYDANREAWRKWRQDVLDTTGRGEEQQASGQYIYIDDASGATPLAPDEPIRGQRPGDPLPTKAFVGVDPQAGGGGARVRLLLFHNKSRAEVHLGLVETTFEEAGWQAAEDKKQLGVEIDLLGHSIDATGIGRMHVQDVKRRGMRADIQRQREAAKGMVPAADVEELTGRCSFLAQVVNEGNAYLQPMYRLKNQTWRVLDKATRTTRKIKPKELDIAGRGPVQTAYREALEWWDTVLKEDTSTPLAPRLSFPRPGEVGCAYLFTDAAREDGTGFGGHATVTVDGVPVFLFGERRWEPDILRALQHDDMSMPAGECVGAVALADALLRILRGTTHLVVFTDSDATARALTTASSGAPQLNFAIRWLVARHPLVQFLGIHQPGARNGAADGLSRQRQDGERVLAEAAEAGLATVRVHMDETAVTRLIAHVRTLPLRRVA
jgi:hypothetical protein